MKITTYNVNGIRSAASKGLRGYIEESGADIVCFQELKALPEQIDAAEFESLGYSCYWYSAQKKGYSGVGIISKEEPNAVVYGCGHELFDAEGRVIRADYDWGSVLSVYFPSGSSGDSRQDVKMGFLEYFFDYVEDLRKAKPNLVVCGDYNVCPGIICCTTRPSPASAGAPLACRKSRAVVPSQARAMDRSTPASCSCGFWGKGSSASDS